jgi:hypothetical protein
MPENTTVDALRRVSLSLIEQERIQQLLFLQTVRDAAVLAGEQVQDVRLDLLEKPPGVSVSGIFMEALISLALGSAASFAIKFFVNRGARGILAARGAVSKKNGVHVVVPSTSASMAQSKKDFLDQELEDLVEAKTKRIELWKIFAVNVVTKLAVRAVRKSDEQPPGGDREGDTASVAIRRAALSFARLQELAVHRVFKEYEDQVRADTADIDLLLSLINYFTQTLPLSRLPEPDRPERRPTRPAREPVSNEEPDSNEDIERKLSLFFEACIWVLHFGGQQAIRKKFESTYTLPAEFLDSPTRLVMPRQEITVLDIDSPLVKYWIHRFPHNKGNGTDSFVFHVIRRGNIHTPRDQSLRDLLSWFADVETGIAGIQKKLQSFGGPAIMDVLGPIKPRSVARP